MVNLQQILLHKNLQINVSMNVVGTTSIILYYINKSSKTTSFVKRYAIVTGELSLSDLTIAITMQPCTYTQVQLNFFKKFKLYMVLVYTFLNHTFLKYIIVSYYIYIYII